MGCVCHWLGGAYGQPSQLLQLLEACLLHQWPQVAPAAEPTAAAAAEGSEVVASWRALGNGWPGLPWQAALAGKGIRHAGGISCGNTTSLGKPLTQQRKKQIDILGHRVDAARPARAGGGLSAQPTHHVQHLCDSLQQGHRHAVSGAPPPLTIWTVRQQAGSAVCTVPAHASLGRLPAHVPPGGLRCHVAPGAANWAAGGHHHKW